MVAGVEDDEINVRVQGEEYSLAWWKQQITTKRMVKCIAFFLYFIIGCLVYNHFEGWKVYETLCFSIVTMATVGYGYRHPTTDGARLFTIFYLLFGVYMIYFLMAKELSKLFVSGVNSVRKRASNDVEAIGLGLAHQKRWISILILCMTISAFIAAGIVQSMERDWSYIESLYMIVQTLATVGYGDLTMNNYKTLSFLAFYIVFTTVLGAFTYNTYQVLREEKKQVQRLHERLQKQKDMSFLTKLDKGDGVSQAEFILASLEHIGTLDRQRDVDPWIVKFKSMKANSNGRVARDALGDFSARESTFATANQEMLRSYQSMTVVNMVSSSFKRTFRDSSHSSEMTNLVHSPWTTKDTADDSETV